MAKNDIYEVTCEGTYYADIDGKKAIKPYTVTAKFSDADKQLGFLSRFRHKILKAQDDGQPSVMVKLYPDWRRFRTHVIVKAINLSENGKPVRELALMNRVQVVAFIDAKGLPIDTALYNSVSDLRQALVDFKENQKSFLKQQERRMKLHGATIKSDKSIEDLNPWLADTTLYGVADAKLSSVDALGADAKSSDTYVNAQEDIALPEYDDADELAELVAGL